MQAISFIKNNQRIFNVVLSAVFIFFGWVVSDISVIVSVLFYLSSYVVGGYITAKETIVSLFREHKIDVNLLMILSAIGAGLIGHWSEGAILIFIFALSGALEAYTTSKSSKDIEALMKIKPKQATALENGVEVLVDIDSLRPGDFIVVKPGEVIAADGIVNTGNSAVNQASITGESVPVDKEKGAEVFAGTLNGEGALIVEVTKSSENSLFSKIIRLVHEAQNDTPVAQRFIDNFEGIYAKAVIAITIMLIVIPPFVLDWSWSDTFYKAMVFMVVASPCALVASIMPAMLSAISNGARKGIVLKGGVHLEQMAGVKLVVFDKTGTLTTGEMRVSDIICFNGLSDMEVLRAAASIESLSQHPIAKAIVADAVRKGIALDRPTSFQSVTGKGLEAIYENENWRIGKPSFIPASAMSAEVSAVIDSLQEHGKTVIVAQEESVVKGVIALQDTVKKGIKEAIYRLKEQGIETAMLTGDQHQTARRVAVEVGITYIHSELLPDDKAQLVKELRGKYGKIAMVGDGVNDAPALAIADVGIAMGAGSDAALETADVVLMNDDVTNIPYTVGLGRKMQRIVKQNIVFSISVIALLVLANFTSGIPLPIGVVGHEGSTILVILNGLRLLKMKK